MEEKNTGFDENVDKDARLQSEENAENENPEINPEESAGKPAGEPENEPAGADAETPATTEKPAVPDVQTAPGADNRHYYTWDGREFAKHKRKSALKALAFTVAVALVISVVGLAAALIHSGSGRDTPGLEQSGTVSGTDESVPHNFSRSDSAFIHPTPEEDETGSLAQLYEACAVSCCSIYIPLKTGYVLGSGFVVDAKEGYVVTNNHVVKQNSGTIEVIFYDNTRYEATLVGRDDLTDIAVLKIDAENLTALPLGNSDEAKIGDRVIAIGTPYDLTLAGTLTNGVISGTDREIKLTNDFGTVVKTMKLLQTNSTINPGNSGGPLINMHGQVIGINTLKLMQDYEGLGFAIPMSYAVKIINNLIDYGEVRDGSGFVKATAKLNITVYNVPASEKEAREAYNLPDDVPEGILVIEVLRNSAIYRAGLEVYDIITEFNGVKIKTYDNLTEELNKYSAGEKITIKVYRINRRGGGAYVNLSFNLDSAS